MVELKYKTDRFVSKPGQLVLVQPEDILPLEEQLPLIRPIKGTQYMQQG